MDRLINYYGQNPQSQLLNQGARSTRLGVGSWIRDAIGNALGSGVFTGVSVTPSGLNILVGPTTTNVPAAFYQSLSPSDPAVPTGSATLIIADPQATVAQALLNTVTGPYGPVAVPTSGLSTYYLLEAQVSTRDTLPSPLTFINQDGTRTSSTLPTTRQDVVSFLLKAGTPSASPTVPTLDAGYMAVATVLVPSGASSLTTGMISVYPAFAGFRQSVPRQVSSITTTSLANNATFTGLVTMAKTYTLIGITTSAVCRVEVYKNAAARTADSGRAIGTAPASTAGVVFDGATSSGHLTMDTPQPVGSNTESTVSTSIPVTITNTSGSTATITVTFTYLPLE